MRVKTPPAGPVSRHFDAGLQSLERCSVVLLSDTHGVLDPRIARLAAQADAVVHAGDIGAGAVLTMLEQCCPVVVAVRGNNDTTATWPADEQRRLDALPDIARLVLPAGTLAVVHGHRHGTGDRRHGRLRADFADDRAVVFGHSHHVCIDRRQTPMILNPGAAGRVRTYGGPSCIVLRATVRDGWRFRTRRFPLRPAR